MQYHYSFLEYPQNKWNCAQNVPRLSSCWNSALTSSHCIFGLLSNSEVFILCFLYTQWQLQKCEMSHGQVCVVPKRLFISLSVISLKGKMLETLQYCLNHQNIHHSSSSPFLLWLHGPCKHNKIVESSEFEIWQKTQNLNRNCKFS